MQVMHNKLIGGVLIGSFRLDLGTVYNEPGNMIDSRSKSTVSMLEIKVVMENKS